MASGGSHTVMPKKLAQALMEAGMQHFDVGGDVAGAYPGGGAVSGNNVDQGSDTTQRSGIDTGQTLQDWGTLNLSGLAGDLRGGLNSFLSQNQFRAGAPPI